MRRALALLAVVLFGFVLVACGDDSGDESTSAASDSASDAIRSDDPNAAVIAQMAANMAKASNGLISEKDAECIAAKFLTQSSAADLQAALAAGEDPRNDPAVRAALTDALKQCVSSGALAQLLTGGSTTTED